MRATRTAIAAWICWGAGSWVLFAQPQPPKVVVKRLQDSDLERTAHSLKISVERLQQARQVLEEATRLLAKAAPDEAARFSQIPALWLKIHRQQAVDHLEDLIMQRSRDVSALESDEEYRALTNWAVRTAAQLAQLHPPRALQALQSWLDPPQRLGESSAELFRQMHSELASDNFASRYSKDPPGSLNRLLEGRSSLGRIRLELNDAVQNKDPQSADQLIDDYLLEVNARPPDRSTLFMLSYMVRRMAWMNNHRSTELSDALVSAYQRYGENRLQQEAYLYETDGRQVELSAGEYQFLTDLRRSAWQPELTLRLVDSWPGLREKIDMLGGVDRAIASRPTEVIGSAEGSQRVRSLRVRNENTFELFRELRYEALARPGWVRKRLEQVAEQGEDAFETLMQLAASARGEHPELAALALEYARPLIDEAEEPAAALKLFVSYARRYRGLEGALTPELIRQGLHLLSALQDEQGSTEDDARRQGASPSGSKSFLIGEWARLDLAGSLAEARAEEDVGRRLQYLVSIVESLIR